MIRLKLSVIFIIFFNESFSQQSSTIPTLDQSWELVWEDNFDSNVIDASKWKVSNYMGGRTLYMSDNVDVLNGNLRLELRNEHLTCPSSNGLDWVWTAAGGCIHNQEYLATSGWVETTDAFDTKYGYIEARINFPYNSHYGISFFPAFWTFRGHTSTYTNGAEIDIVEILGYKAPDSITTNAHTCYDDTDPTCKIRTKAYSANYSNTFHKYAIEWNPDKITWYYDGVVIREKENHNINDEIRIILNFAYSEGYPLPNTPYISTYMLVDYVKVYQLKSDCHLSYSVCNFPFSSYAYSVKKSIKIGGTGCNNVQPVNTNVVLRANDFVEIINNFEVPLGSELDIVVQPCF